MAPAEANALKMKLYDYAGISRPAIGLIGTNRRSNR